MDDRSGAAGLAVLRQRGVDDRREIQDSIYLAVELLKSQHEIDETAAFIMLVDASSERRLSIRDTAGCLTEEAVLTPRARQRAIRIVRQSRGE
jgi:hypothetical protein